MKKALFALLICCMVVSVHAQSEQAYETESADLSSELLDPARFSINHSLSFGMGGQVSDLKSQSLYSTMMRYEFDAPVTLRMNLGFPIHSTSSNSHNLNEENLQNMDYFREMPLDISVDWNPSRNFMMSFSFVRQPHAYNRQSGFYPHSNLFFESYNRNNSTRPSVSRLNHKKP
ncbi:hypothetical protein QA601_18235 [Chitinispirillales bacterium ANBcel5]|uniref:hypothetical protein n=1 Tax=Cellulosispirillum alkaliphilum TaxID=3039283 RepID=UPI002A52CEDE|nr:hypothetical protein [Chitinispirillales bacterium ANBcel5]